MKCGGGSDCNSTHDEHMARAQAVNERMAQVKHKIIVLSGKGGVGKSTVAVNLAIGLALEGKQVGLLDIDLHGPTVPQLLGLRDRPVVIEGETLVPVDVGESLKVMSIGFLLGEQDDAVVWRGPMKAIAIQQFLGEVQWGELDYLVIDSPPGTGDEPLAVCQAIGKMDGAVIVTTPQETALGNVRRSVRFCSLLELPVLGVIENMAGFVCPNCGQVTHVFSKGGGGALATKAGVPLLASIPLDPAIVEAGDAGRPYIYHYSKSPAATEFAKAVEKILELVETEEEQHGPEDLAQLGSLQGSESVPTALPEVDAVWRFAVPVTDGVLSQHFGHCQEFALVDVDASTKQVIGMTAIEAPEHEPGLLPAWLADKGARYIIAGGMGNRAQQLFAQQGVAVIIGAPVGDPKQLVEEYLAGSLKTGDNVCDH